MTLQPPVSHCLSRIRRAFQPTNYPTIQSRTILHTPTQVHGRRTNTHCYCTTPHTHTRSTTPLHHQPPLRTRPTNQKTTNRTTRHQQISPSKHHHHNNNRNIKITYHNKNQDIHLTKHQNVGRLHDYNAPSTHAQKAANISCLLTLVHDFTTLDIDMLKPAAAIIIEAAQLHYQPNIILSALHRANRTRPSHVWHALSHIAKHTN